MLKGIFFSFGLVNGAYVGIKMRDAGFTTALTKSYYGNSGIQNNVFLNMDPKELNEFYQKGLLDTPEKLENFALVNNIQDLERMQEILNKERQDKMNREPKVNNVNNNK